MGDRIYTDHAAASRRFCGRSCTSFDVHSGLCAQGCICEAGVCVCAAGKKQLVFKGTESVSASGQNVCWNTHWIG